jgi:hypothetical protein
MPFAYYQRLSRRQQAVYRKSAKVTAIRLPRAGAARPLAGELREALARDDRLAVAEAAHELASAITQDLSIPPVAVDVLAVRPHRPTEELHGLYTWEPGKTPVIRVWMRTAKQRRVVAFRTFLRTLVHELCHHIDFTLLRLDDSFHTEGFFRRESSLVRQLVGGPSEPAMVGGRPISRTDAGRS